VLQTPHPAPPRPDALKNSDFKDVYEVYRKQMEHEDTLVNHRITFSSVIQTALVTAFVFAHNLSQHTGEEAAKDVDVLIIRRSICVIGLIMVVYAFIGIMAAVVAWRKLARKATEVLVLWRAHAATQEPVVPIPERPYGGGSATVDVIGTIFGPWAFLVFAVLWGYALYYLSGR
jgi:hypothetical protein